MERREIEEIVRRCVMEKLENGGKEYIVAANWKMNMSAKAIKSFLEEMNQVEIPKHLRTIIFPPYPYLNIFQKMLRYSRITYGAQDIAKEEKGAYTGEVSADMLIDMGCSYTLTGHSERRSYYAETPEIVAEKTRAAIMHSLTPVICIGETLEQRQSGRYKEILKAQLDAVEASVRESMGVCMIAYEPVWAIGTGVIPKISEIRDTHKFIHEVLISYGGTYRKTVPILYGGSVSEKNVRESASVKYVNGFLIGGASLNAERFKTIIKLLSVD